MSFSVRFLILLGLSSLFFFRWALPTQALSEFTTSYEVFYEADTEGNLKVRQNVTLTNNFSQLYASEYTFRLERVNPQNISAYDKNGPLNVTTERQEETTNITVQFGEPVVGKNQTLKFTLNYELPELLRHSGYIWELTLPKISFLETIEDYRLTLKVPTDFGPPAYLAPSPKSQQSEAKSTYFFYEKNQLSSTSLVVVFGKFQIFDFQLTYHLSNPTQETVWTKIALPPETNYQEMTYQQITPEPENVEVDEDGNWLARYILKPNEKIEVKAKGKVKISALPQNNQPLFASQDLQKYLTGQKYWEIDNPQIKELAKQLKTPKRIFDYVVSKLDYDYSRVRAGAKRLGALESLSQPERAICMEYTDLFIALARAAGIPARELNGYAYTDNPVLQPLSLVQDVLHSWPEYWNQEKGVWVQVDPTWQDTTGGLDYFSKFDLGHFVFVIHGTSSEKPLPAGAYKETGVAKKDVQINFGQYQESQPPRLKVDFLLPKEAISERKTEGKIRIVNSGNKVISNLEIKIETSGLKIFSETTKMIPVLPPFGHQEIPLKLASTEIFGQGSGQITVSGNQQKFTHQIRYRSLVLVFLLPIIGVCFLLVLIYLFVRRIIKLRFQQETRQDEVL